MSHAVFGSTCAWTQDCTGATTLFRVSLLETQLVQYGKSSCCHGHPGCVALVSLGRLSPTLTFACCLHAPALQHACPPVLFQCLFCSFHVAASPVVSSCSLSVSPSVRQVSQLVSQILVSVAKHHSHCHSGSCRAHIHVLRCYSHCLRLSV